MSDVEWAQRLLPLLPLVLALVAGLVLARVVSGQARRVEAARLAVGPTRSPAGHVQGRWFALVGMTTLGATLFHNVGTRSGTRELRDGVLTWTPHSRQPGWQDPVPELAVERVRFGVGNVQPITLESAASGTVGVHVSLDAMPTAFTLNATKQRNLAYADDFVAALLAAGARPR